MSTMANADATQLMRIRAEEVLDRKGGGASRQAGELAGHFSAMLEQLNGVDETAGTGAVDAAASGGPVTGFSQRVGVGAVSLFAQSLPDDGGGEAATTPDPQSALATDPQTVVDAALANGDGANFRWLTTLLTQSAAS